MSLARRLSVVFLVYTGTLVEASPQGAWGNGFGRRALEPCVDVPSDQSIAIQPFLTNSVNAINITLPTTEDFELIEAEFGEEGKARAFTVGCASSIGDAAGTELGVPSIVEVCHSDITNESVAVYLDPVTQEFAYCGNETDATLEYVKPGCWNMEVCFCGPFFFLDEPLLDSSKSKSKGSGKKESSGKSKIPGAEKSEKSEKSKEKGKKEKSNKKEKSEKATKAPKPAPGKEAKKPAPVKDAKKANKKSKKKKNYVGYAVGTGAGLVGLMAVGLRVKYRKQPTSRTAGPKRAERAPRRGRAQGTFHSYAVPKASSSRAVAVV